MKKQKIHPGITKLASFAIILMLLGPLQGCMFYYKVQTEPLVRQQEIKKYDSLDKYMILHQRDRAWHLSQPLISGNMVTSKLSELPSYRYKFQITKPKGGNRYLKKKRCNESYVLDEVHLYLSEDVVPERTDSGSVMISFSQIQTAELYVKAKGRTTTSWLIPAIVGPVLVGGVVGSVAVVVSLGNMNIGSLAH